MSRLPESMSFLRPFIHRLRIFTRRYAFFRFFVPAGGGGVVPQQLEPVLEGMRGQYLNLLDRLAVLESSLNWRLHGIPARIENISLEQLPVLSGTGVVRQALAKLALRSSLPVDLIKQAFSGTPEGSSYFLVEDSQREVGEILKTKSPAKLFSIADPSDLFFSETNLNDLKPNGQRVVAPLLDAAARLTRPEFDCIWLSDAVERLTPIQIQALFLSVSIGITGKGRCIGIFADFKQSDAGLYWTDPRRLRPMTREVISFYANNAGFKEIQFTESRAMNGIVYVLFEIESRTSK